MNAILTGGEVLDQKLDTLTCGKLATRSSLLGGLHVIRPDARASFGAYVL